MEQDISANEKSIGRKRMMIFIYTPCKLIKRKE